MGDHYFRQQAEAVPQGTWGGQRGGWWVGDAERSTLPCLRTTSMLGIQHVWAGAAAPHSRDAAPAPCPLPPAPVSPLPPTLSPLPLPLAGAVSDRLRRVTKEIATLPGQLPLSWESGVLVGMDEDRMDVLRVSKGGIRGL